MAIFKQRLWPRPAGPSEQELPPTSGGWARARSLTVARVAPELIVLIGASATLNFWDLSLNRWANTYYAAAVRSMSTSWHNFLYASLDPSGVMSVDKPPLTFWIQALSVRVFGYHPLSILIPDALMGVATVVLIYDLVRRLFGRPAGFIAGLALATTPMTVAMSRHNNPDVLVALFCVAALWFFVRAVQDGRTRWIVLSGVMVGLGFEAKMGIALVVVPGIVLAWLVLRPRGWRRALDQLIAGGIAMTVVGGAWPLLVALTPADNRPWLSGTANNNILSLIFDYNGFGRVSGQSGGPPPVPRGVGAGVFGGATGPLRLLNSELGGQAGWLLGVALLSGLAILAATRLRRSDPRTPWIIAVGGSFLATAVVFSVAHGIFHPYYVSLLAPFTAAVVGAGAGQLLSGRLGPSFVAAGVLAVGVLCELVVLGDYRGQLTWIQPLLLGVVGAACLVCVLTSNRPARAVAISAAVAALLVAPSIWAIDTLGYPTQATFPAGGPAKDNSAGMARRHPNGAFGGGGGRPLVIAGSPPGHAAQGVTGAVGSLFGNRGRPASSPGGPRAGFGAAQPGFAPPTPAISASAIRDPALARIVRFVRRHGGGTIAVSSQSQAAKAIIKQNANVAGIGGWSGRESDPTVAWFASEVNSGHVRWVYSEGLANFDVAADGRVGDTAVLEAATRACVRVDASNGARIPGRFSRAEFKYTPALFDCAGKGAALAALAG
ncbi:MAG: glycosyltransferase family 39 protein [Solirubrobacteraceae bacterium]|jgi:4-amino-4-deoxy-L-arabinose transferase-like glycosyltransferase